MLWNTTPQLLLAGPSADSAKVRHITGNQSTASLPIVTIEMCPKRHKLGKQAALEDTAASCDPCTGEISGHGQLLVCSSDHMAFSSHDLTRVPKP